VRQAIFRHAVRVKERVSPDAPFGLGLRLSALAAEKLAAAPGAFRDELERAGMYVFTVNGFPYGRFHGGHVKENVYLPDWTTPQRLRYTISLAEILAVLLPEELSGTISTSPVVYGKDLPATAIENLLAVSQSLEELQERTGREIHLALEPEPDCYLETAAEVLAFFELLRSRRNGALPDHLGICLDTCHHAVNFERPAEVLATLTAAGIPVRKIQISAALRVRSEQPARELLEPFAEEVYLHQTRVRNADGLHSFPDLPAALEAAPEGEWRTHFHVPLNYESSGGLETTADLLDAEFLAAAATPGRHLEIETYTFDRLPGTPGDVVDAVVGEFDWLRIADDLG